MIDLNTADIKLCIDLNSDGTKKEDARFLHDGTSTLEITSGETDEVLLLSTENKCADTYYIYSRQGDYEEIEPNLLTASEIIGHMQNYVANDKSLVVELVEAFIEYTVFI